MNMNVDINGRKIDPVTRFQVATSDRAESSSLPNFSPDSFPLLSVDYPVQISSRL